MKVLAVALLAPLGALAQYGPDPDGVPADFLCGWRKLALSYSSALRPDAAGLVHDALELHKYCNGTVPRPDDASLPAVFPPRFASPAAAAKPTPLFAPVTMACLPSRLIASSAALKPAAARRYPCTPNSRLPVTYHCADAIMLKRPSAV